MSNPIKIPGLKPIMAEYLNHRFREILQQHHRSHNDTGAALAILNHLVSADDAGFPHDKAPAQLATLTGALRGQKTSNGALNSAVRIARNPVYLGEIADDIEKCAREAGLQMAAAGVSDAIPVAR